MINGSRSTNIEEQNFKMEDIEDILTVNFNGINFNNKNGSFKSYYVAGNKSICTNLNVRKKIKEIRNKCCIDDILNIAHKNFFDLGVVFDSKGFTLCLGSDQEAEIFDLYDVLFHDLTIMVSDILESEYHENTFSRF